MKLPQYKESETCNPINSMGPVAREFARRGTENDHARNNPLSSRVGGEWQTVQVLETANNKLQELMQLLYLASRDPAVPKDARYHVTLAQSEIALLIRLMQNAAAAETEAAGASATGTHP
ncbi:MAG TPA: hypothetical protein VKV05_13345 [Terriglobales bacterium]|nr:hypothetical protein [Terriglobales bacterium]